MKTDEIKDDQPVVNVFALTNQDRGLNKPWQSGNRPTRITLAQFYVNSSEIVRTIYYADGSSHQDSSPLQLNPLPCSVK
jgi:hypothetical protein